MSEKELFDQVNLLWLGYDENGEREERNLKLILQNVGVTEDWYREQLAKHLTFD